MYIQFHLNAYNVLRSQVNDIIGAATLADTISNSDSTLLTMTRPKGLQFRK